MKELQKWPQDWKKPHGCTLKTLKSSIYFAYNKKKKKRQLIILLKYINEENKVDANTI